MNSTEIDSDMQGILEFLVNPDKKLVIKVKGGPGSGNFSHAGRPGKRGGSAPAKTPGAGGVLSWIEHDYISTNNPDSPDLIPNVGSADATPELKAKLFVGLDYQPFDRLPIPDVKDIQGWVNTQKEIAGVDVLKCVNKIVFHYSSDDLITARIEADFDVENTNADNKRTNQSLGYIKGTPEFDPAAYRLLISQKRRDYGGLLGFFNPIKKEIHMGELRNNEIRPADGGDSAPADLIFYHESAHAIHHASRSGIEWNTKWRSDGSFDRFTMYSTLNPNEGFAESYLSHLEYKKRMRDIRTPGSRASQRDEILRSVRFENVMFWVSQVTNGI